MLLAENGIEVKSTDDLNFAVLAEERDYFLFHVDSYMRDKTLGPC